jgi:CheY-like chemotaxis protein
MTDELLSLRALVMSPDRRLRDLFRQAASAPTVPVEIIEAEDGAGVSRKLATGADLVYIDGAAPPGEIAQAIEAAAGTAKPPFTVHLAAADTESFACDALAGKPSQLEEAQRLLDRSTRLRVPTRVLVVDDSSTMRSIVRKTLTATRFPFDVSIAGEGEAAIKLVRDGGFDLVFLDYNMPELNGLETLAEFKRAKQDLTVVMITSTKDEALAARAGALGAAFLKKPFFPADIEAILSGFYGLRAINPKRA